jgi:hypothetical protein
MKHICSACLSNLDTFEKDEDTVVVMPCEYCRMEELKLARLCNEGMKRINAIASERGQIHFTERNDDALLCEAINKMGR